MALLFALEAIERCFFQVRLLHSIIHKNQAECVVEIWGEKCYGGELPQLHASVIFKMRSDEKELDYDRPVIVVDGWNKSIELFATNVQRGCLDGLKAKYRIGLDSQESLVKLRMTKHL
jgi:hypothetical protein